MQDWDECKPAADGDYVGEIVARSLQAARRASRLERRAARLERQKQKKEVVAKCAMRKKPGHWIH